MFYDDLQQMEDVYNLHYVVLEETCFLPCRSSSKAQSTQ